jgi:multifunctional beta-oxidation protein
VGVKAVAAVCSAEDGDAIVKAAVDAFGTVHVLVANAGLLRDKTIMGMTDEMWDLVISVHLKGTYKVSYLIYVFFRMC